ncbi:MAG: CHAP domain-containing protein, partial [Brevundimonas sp.]|nr:CHAP domain-containing protein [Brevundimonas sp.]
VVSEVLTDRVIRITHANWGGSRGRVEENVTVVDVSNRGDWTAVKVWYNPSRALGSSVYPTYGFIHKAPSLPTDGVLMASTPNASGQP